MNPVIQYIVHAADVYELPIGHYPDGSPLIDYTVRPDGIEDGPWRMIVRSARLEKFVASLFWVDALQERGLDAPDLVLPYVPGARQDRLNDSGDYLFTLKSIASMINHRNFARVTIVDPHSDVAPALIARSHVITAADCINPPAGKYQAVIAPDGGAEKRAGAVAKKLGVPLYHGWKRRDVKTGDITGFGCERLPDDVGTVLVVDDICDGGGTFVGLRKHIPREVTVDLWVTHGLFTKGTERLLEDYRHIYCTDSIDGPREGVIEVKICKLLLMKGTL